MNATKGIIQECLGLPVEGIAFGNLVTGIGGCHGIAVAQQTGRITDGARTTTYRRKHHAAIPVIDGQGHLKADGAVDDATDAAVRHRAVAGRYQNTRFDGKIEVR